MTLEQYASSEGKTVDKVKAEYEKLNAAQDIVLRNADKAYATAGLSANEYIDTVTSFSASLLQSLDGDTVAAAKKADVAIRDMADYCIVRVKRAEPYQGCGAKRRQEMAA